MIKWSRKTWIIVISVLIAVSFLFQGRLFFPHLNLVATPEFELNDAIQLSFASKYWYFLKLHALQLPFWSMQIGNGFPILGEGQTGIWYLPNILCYILSPSPEIAYILSLVLITFITSLGTCLWLAVLGVTPVIATLAGISFGAGGFFLFHLQHMTLLQSFSLLPFLFIATHTLVKKQRFRDVLILAFLFSQQIFAGFIQAVFITFIGTTIYAFFLWRQSGTQKRAVVLFFLAYTLGIVLAAPQLLPSIEFYTHVIEQSATNGFSTKFSFAPKSFLSFLNPFAIGNPKYATYYKNTHDEGLLFWETNGYIGLIPLVLFSLSLLSKKIRSTVLPWIVITGVGILLMLGKYSPFYFIFDFFPFSLFRVPARFVILVSFSLIVVAAISSMKLMQTKSHALLCIIRMCWIVNILSFLPYWYTYHLYQAPSVVTQPPEILNALPKDGAVYRFDAANQHRTQYTTYGWMDPKRFAIFQNILRPNTNVFWGATTFDAYPSRTLTNKSVVDQIVNSHTEIIDSHTAHMTTAATNLLILTGNSAIVSGDEIRMDQQFTLGKRISDGTSTLYLYVYERSIPRAYFATMTIPVQTVSDVIAALENPAFDPTGTILSSTAQSEQHTVLLPSDTLSITTWSDQNVILQTTTQQPVTVVLNMTYYPGWIATIDGKETQLTAANIVSTALSVPAGTHVVRLTYHPRSEYTGIVIAGFGVFAVVCVALLRKQIRFLRKLFPE